MTDTAVVEMEVDALRYSIRRAEAELARLRADLERAEAELSLDAEREFLEASVAVWREIDRLSDKPGGYKGLVAETDLRKVERAAWERYKAALDERAGLSNVKGER